MIVSVPALRRGGSRAARMCRSAWERLHYAVIRRRPAGAAAFGQKRLLAGGNLEDVSALYKDLFPRLAEIRILDAGAIRDHQFDLLGSGPTTLSAGEPAYQPLDWHRDFKSGYRWDPDTFYRDIRYGQTRGVDVKVPWELSRFQHLTTLGQAYALTSRPEYRAEFVGQIDDWMGHNPVGFGVNWACTMDVAIRAANWLAAAEWFLGDEGLDAGFLGRLYGSIHEHGKFIRHHLERSDGGTTNHYLANIAGLLFIAVYCPFFRESRRWREFCIRELIREMDSQVYADGCHFEASTCYHRLALELFFFATALIAMDEGVSADGDYSRAAQRAFGPEYVEKLHAMFTAVLHLLKPNGRMPQIGDNDSGRFLVFESRDILDMRYLLSIGAVFFYDPQLKVQEFGLAPDALWLFGRQGYDTWKRLEGRSVATIPSRAFPDAGWYVIRRHPDYCLVSCGPNGAHGRGGHAHNDKLSIELMLDGRPVIVDPGTYLYTSLPDQRNLFRATGCHNTLVVDGCEQNELPKDLFRLPDRVWIRRARLTEGAEQTCFTGAVEYAGIVHERTVSVNKVSGRWSVEDRVSSPRPAGGEIRFHLSPHVISRDGGIFEKDSETAIAGIEAGNAPLQTATYDYSPEYGVVMKAQSVSVRIPDMTNAVVTTVFSRECPNAGSSPKSVAAGSLPNIKTCVEAV